MKEVQVINSNELSDVKKQEIENAFLVKKKEIEIVKQECVDIINSEITVETSAKASILIKKLSPIRTGIAKIHKVQKSFFWNAGKFVDSIKVRDTLI